MSKLKVFFSNVSYSLFANALRLIVSVASYVLIPVIMGDRIDQYGYFQVYLFYIGYIGLFQLGIGEGALLQEGGKEYADLDRSKYSFQFRFLLAGELLISIVIIILVTIFNDEVDYVFIAFAFGANLLIYLPRDLLAYLLQASNRIKEATALITIIGRSTYLLCLIILWNIHYQRYYLFAAADILSKLCELIYIIIVCRDIVFARQASWLVGIRGVIQNISAGIKLMFTGIANLIITGITRFAIQQEWDVITYGKISLMLSTTNLVLTFISAMAVVLYPALRRIGPERAISLYHAIRDILMALLLCTVIFCYPLQVIMMKIFPQYHESLVYIPILFPACIFSAKVTMLIQTYMQVFRLEREILKVNLLTVGVAMASTAVSVYVYHSLMLAVVAILFTTAFRCLLAEYVLSKRLGISVFKDSVIEILYVSLFVAISFLIGEKQGMLISIPVYLIYVTAKAKSVIAAWNLIRQENE